MRHSRLAPLAAILLALSCPAPPAAAADDEREARQAELDRACESAREQKLRPLRQQLIEQCVANREFETRLECEQYFADYGAQSGNRAPLYYDLPPCVEAFEYAQSERSSG